MFTNHPILTRLALRQLRNHATDANQQQIFDLALQQHGDNLNQIAQTLDDSSASDPSTPQLGQNLVAIIQLLIANLPEVMTAVETLLSLLGVIKQPVPTPTPAPATT